jgi:hypothetical protein
MVHGWVGSGGLPWMYGCGLDGIVVKILDSDLKSDFLVDWS